MSNESSSYLREDQVNKLIQRLFSINPGIEGVANVPNIRLKGPWWGAQVTQKVCDHVSQAWFSIKGFAVKIKIVVLCTNKNKWPPPQKKTRNIVTTADITDKKRKWKCEELTSDIIPAGTNSGALAERVDEFNAGASRLLLSLEDVLCACALCWGMLCLFTSANQTEAFS